ncbi:hypothetical protein, partial [Bradyrhizobium sp.]|uniref:hypothetical protein n=1 Tax=Bradyrhizobium sp. TaxID=376 RepID=UPI003C44CAF1
MTDGVNADDTRIWQQVAAELSRAVEKLKAADRNGWQGGLPDMLSDFVMGTGSFAGSTPRTADHQDVINTYLREVATRLEGSIQGRAKSDLLAQDPALAHDPALDTLANTQARPDVQSALATLVEDFINAAASAAQEARRQSVMAQLATKLFYSGWDAAQRVAREVTEDKTNWKDPLSKVAGDNAERVLEKQMTGQLQERAEATAKATAEAMVNVRGQVIREATASATRGPLAKGGEMWARRSPFLSVRSRAVKDYLNGEKGAVGLKEYARTFVRSALDGLSQGFVTNRSASWDGNTIVATYLRGAMQRLEADIRTSHGTDALVQTAVQQDLPGLVDDFIGVGAAIKAKRLEINGGTDQWADAHQTALLNALPQILSDLVARPDQTAGQKAVVTTYLGADPQQIADTIRAQTRERLIGERPAYARLIPDSREAEVERQSAPEIQGALALAARTSDFVNAGASGEWEKVADSLSGARQDLTDGITAKIRKATPGATAGSVADAAEVETRKQLTSLVDKFGLDKHDAVKMAATHVNEAAGTARRSIIRDQLTRMGLNGAVLDTATAAAFRAWTQARDSNEDTIRAILEEGGLTGPELDSVTGAATAALVEADPELQTTRNAEVVAVDALTKKLTGDKKFAAFANVAANPQKAENRNVMAKARGGVEKRTAKLRKQAPRTADRIATRTTKQSASSIARQPDFGPHVRADVESLFEAALNGGAPALPAGAAPAARSRSVEIALRRNAVPDDIVNGALAATAGATDYARTSTPGDRADNSAMALRLAGRLGRSHAGDARKAARSAAGEEFATRLPGEVFERSFVAAPKGRTKLSFTENAVSKVAEKFMRTVTYHAEVY